MKAKTPQASGKSPIACLGERRARRALHVVGHDRQREVVGQHGYDHRLGGQDQADAYVPPAEPADPGVEVRTGGRRRAQCSLLVPYHASLSFCLSALLLPRSAGFHALSAVVVDTIEA